MRELTTIGEFLAHWRPRLWPKATWTAEMRADRSTKRHCSLTLAMPGRFQLIEARQRWENTNLRGACPFGIHSAHRLLLHYSSGGTL